MLYKSEKEKAPLCAGLAAKTQQNNVPLKIKKLLVLLSQENACELCREENNNKKKMAGN